MTPKEVYESLYAAANREMAELKLQNYTVAELKEIAKAGGDKIPHWITSKGQMISYLVGQTVRARLKFDVLLNIK